MPEQTDILQHNIEIAENRVAWDRKPALRACYSEFYQLIKARMATSVGGHSLEVGSGMGMIKTVIADCLTSDIFDNQWLDFTRVSAYSLPFDDGVLANIILFDVFHHLRHPGAALREFQRTLKRGGRVILFEPGFGLLGRVVYERFHHEPCGFGLPIEWEAPAGFDSAHDRYYAAQGNAWRFAREFHSLPCSVGWRTIETRAFSALAYLATGGFRGPSLYPAIFHPGFALLDRLLSNFPQTFASRLLIVLEKC